MTITTIPTGWKLVPLEPTPEIIAGAAIAAWPTASAADVDLARAAAPLVLMKLNMAPGTSIELLAAGLATMAPAYRAMLAAAPAAPAAEHNSQDPACSCPSGNGSLRWPCSVHAAADAQNAVTDGWKWVPLEPTEAMVHAGEDVEPPRPFGKVYRAMLAVAPTARVPAPVDGMQSAAVRDVLAERRRQVEAEGYEVAHDDEHVQGEIGAYAAFYAMPPGAREWPAEETGHGATRGEAIVPEGWGPPKPGDRRRELVKAGALILAELERLDRAAAQPAGMVCDVPPPGWYCTRVHGHDGPCAAHPADAQHDLREDGHHD